MSVPTSKKSKITIPLVVAGALSSLLLALGMSPTFSAFAASITNTANNAGSGALTMQEADSTGLILCNSTDGGSVSTNAATCSTINKFGGNMLMVPGQTITTTVTVKNTGTVAATGFSLTPGACVQSTNGTVNGTANDLCQKVNLVIKSGGTTIYSGTASAFGSAGVQDINNKLSQTSVAAGATVPFSFAVTLDSSTNNTEAGLKVTQPMTWTFGA